jgi:arginine-tRNA-protein transferase
MDDQPSDDRLGHAFEASADWPSVIQADRPNVDADLVMVYDGLQACPYLPDRVARMPLQYPKRRLTGEDLDRLLMEGYRRSGAMFYRTRCPGCRACIATRVDVQRFQWTKSFKRIINRARRELQIAWGRPKVDTARLNVFNRHRAVRGLGANRTATAADYHEFLVASCVDTREIVFEIDGQLIGTAIVDVGADSFNAVYTHFDPDFGRYSIGTLAVLTQIERAMQSGRRYVYLGLYVAQNRHLNYKARFLPQQRLLGDHWRDVVQPADRRL